MCARADYCELTAILLHCLVLNILDREDESTKFQFTTVSVFYYHPFSVI